jgi:isoquinoline 1-oxidoreductase alpha subunit
MPTYRFQLDGSNVAVHADEELPLLYALRHRLGLKGAHCAAGCSACTVHIDGEPVRSCLLPVSAAAGKIVTTRASRPARIA